MLQIESTEHIQQQINVFDSEVLDQRKRIEGLVEERAKVNTQISSMIDPELQIIERRIAQMESMEAAKVARLRELSHDTYKAVEWLNNNKSQFKHTIHNPIMLSISARSNEYVPFIEDVIAVRDFLAFVCEDVDDMNRFITVVRQEMKLDVNAVHSATSNTVNYKPHNAIHDMRRLGGEIYMLNCIEAPIPILNYLCQAYRVHNILLGNDNLGKNAQRLPPQIQLFFTPRNKFKVIKSRYSDRRMTSSTTVGQKRLLNVEINAKLLNELKKHKIERIRERDQIRNQRANIELKIQSGEKLCADMYKGKNELQKKIYVYEDFQKKVERQRQKLERLANETIDVDGANEEFVEQTKQILQSIRDKASAMVSTYETYSERSLAVRKAKGNYDIFRNNTRNLDVEIMECNEELGRRKTYCSRISDLLDQQKRKCKEKRDAARKMTNNKQPNDGDSFPFKNDFDELSNDKNELLEEIENIANQISVRSANDQRTLDEYIEKRDKIERLRKEVDEANTASGDVEREMNDLHRKWFPRIQKMVESINVMFGKFMKSMNCAGEIELKYPSEHDYEQYGIEIRVKYRNNGNLCKLDRFVQSGEFTSKLCGILFLVNNVFVRCFCFVCGIFLGGERAVAIAVYSLSLQHLSQVPFRCVDEINQGMDQSNERRIFKMLVNNVAKLGQSQFFYVTPKLQTSLRYNEHVNCLTVFNGRTEERRLPFARRS